MRYGGRGWAVMSNWKMAEYEKFINQEGVESHTYMKNSWQTMFRISFSYENGF